MPMTYELEVSNETDMQQFGRLFASKLPAIITIFLRGDLGVGKTTLVRFIIQAMDPAQTVKSPTFTLVESYVISEIIIYHFDLYRVNQPQELDFIGANDYFGTGICFIEWPENGGNCLPQADLDCTIKIVDNKRHIAIFAQTALGEKTILSLREGILTHDE